MRISRAHWDELVAHARDEAPNECCGYLSAREGEVQEVFRAENERRSPYGYSLDNKSLFAANELDDEGYEVGIYHSHWTHLIVSLENGDAPDVRAWKIADGAVKDEELVVGA